MEKAHCIKSRRHIVTEGTSWNFKRFTNECSADLKLLHKIVIRNDIRWFIFKFTIKISHFTVLLFCGNNSLNASIIAGKKCRFSGWYPGNCPRDAEKRFRTRIALLRHSEEGLERCQSENQPERQQSRPWQPLAP